MQLSSVIYAPRFLIRRLEDQPDNPALFTAFLPQKAQQQSSSSPLFLKMSLTSLPLLPLEKIASYLDFSSLVSLAASTSSLAHFQPKEQLVKGEDFSVAGGSYRKRKGEKRTPEYYFDVEVKTCGLLGIKMTWEWEGLVRDLINVKF